ncbi:tetratricopeptide repeat protein [Emticicia sp. 21SJ11W-3]|uniref:tetratricopeptide repeat protein n=1 Tax=Emticicia sp. 21SJ11W-3 TaxID=2916755 RepID=UPI0020A0CB4E|nr:tetratricopeptide repeat protein [Emticicia sp. 21SJ11W-3]UTA66933.1 tetratricopeptide repeat protein [Emticicia sp. 21SJ11W-3]
MLRFLFFLLIPFGIYAQRVRVGENQHENHTSSQAEAHDGGVTHDNHSHLEHILGYRKETVYVPNLPPPVFFKGIGEVNFKISTKSAKTQQYFNQGIALLHCFWDFEAYRAFKEAIKHDSLAIMPYYGLYSAIGAIEGDEFKPDQKLALAKIKQLKEKASDREKLYAEAIILRDDEKTGGKAAYQSKLELIIHKYPEDVDAKLFLALSKMAGYDTKLNPREGQLYSEYLLKDILRNQPDNAAAHHYWIHLKENCCPEDAFQSAETLSRLAPNSGHMVHMPGHVYYKAGLYQKAYESFIAAVKVDSAYMKDQKIPEVDAWNYIHNINYLLSNCAEDGRYNTALYYAEKLKNMPATKERKRKFEGRFFYQGVIAPAKMELCFGFYQRAADKLAAIRLDKDSLFTNKAIAYKNALFHFASGMAAIKANNIALASQHSEALDAHLWRNLNQSATQDQMNARRVSDLNVASLELQGVIQSAEGNYDAAIETLELATQKEEDLGYSEPPTYARPVLISLAEAHLKAGKFEKAEKTYQQLLNKHPNSANGIWGLCKVYKQKNDHHKLHEYQEKLNEVLKYGDKSLFPL